jgi:DNA-binding transcriptional ArsR family regulator
MMDIYEVLADPTRRRILDLLRERPHTVGELTDLMKITQPGVSKHLRILREMDLVMVLKQAQRHLYVLRPQPLIEIDRWLSAYRELWEVQLDRFEEYLRSLPREENDDEQEP